MRYTDLICFSLILVLFSSTISGLFSQILKSERHIDELRKQTDSLIFISESFYDLCRGEGFSSLDEWKRVSGQLWELESIESGVSGDEENPLFWGRWKGPYGEGEVYGRRQETHGKRQ